MVASKEPDGPVRRPTKGTPDEPGESHEAEAVTGRPPDIDEAENTTFASRRKDREKSEKRISEAQNKAVQSSSTK